MFRQQNGLVDPMEVPINRSVLGDKKYYIANEFAQW